MAKTIIKGDHRTVNFQLIRHALDNQPSLVIDCANCANPHKFFPEYMAEDMHGVYVMNAEAIYRFRDALKQAGSWAKKLKAKCIIVTTIQALYSYDDETENQNVVAHCYEIIDELAKTYDVIVGISEDGTYCMEPAAGR